MALDAQVRAALQRLGVDADVALTGMSAKFTEAIGSVKLLAGQYDRLRQSGLNAAAALEQGLDAALKRASNPAEFKALVALIERLGREGKLSAEQVALAIEKIGEKADQVTPGINSVAEAFKNLHVTSDAELRATADRARQSFEQIRSSGTASARELQQAFAAYAEKAIAANGGVASASLQVEAGMHKVRIAADEAGNAVVSSMGTAAAATSQLGAQAEAAAAKYAVLGATIADLPAPGGTPPGGPPPPGGGRKTYSRMDNGQTALLARAERLGGLALRKEIEAEWQQKGKSMGRMAGLDPRYAKMLQGTVERLDELQMKQERDSGRFSANEPRVAGSAPRETVTTFRVEIGTGAGRVAAINTASRADADALVGLLRQLEDDARRA
ncbi:hypothetical protein MXC99_00780 [Thauera aromatica]|nr:hypothetical protein [Thauera aromatica]